MIAVVYTGLKFTKGVFNPKPKALEEEALEEGGWTPKLIHVFADFVKHKKWSIYELLNVLSSNLHFKLGFIFLCHLSVFQNLQI